MRREFMWMSVALAGALSGCGGNAVNVAYNAVEHKMVLHPNRGDVIKWIDPKGNPVKVDFPAGNPCKKDDPVGTCTINVDAAVVPYDCAGCADPEIVVGSDISILGGAAIASTHIVAADRVPTPVYIQCNSNQIAVYPPEVQIPKATVMAGASVAWLRGGIPPAGKDWKVDGFSTPICSNNPPFQDGNATCNLKTDVAANTYTYNVSLPSCSNTPLMGAKITVTP
jgi:hypothetical protein